MSQWREDELLRRAKPLFVGGPARSGTTAFTNYLNQHEKVLLCEERYKGRQNRVSWDLFSFERIMDFSKPEETKRPPLAQTREQFIDRHARLLSEKDPSKLKWLGDKGPFYVRSMDRLAGNNPGARFIIMYRPIEEVAESWDSRAKNPDDPWSSERGVEKSVEVWNAAMRGVRDFVQNSPAPRVLIVGYHDFFYRNEAVAPQISRFLGLDFDESVTRAWKERSHDFEGRRRRKRSLAEDQMSYIRQHADREAEAWVLDRIDRQWAEPGLYAEESDEARLASLDGIEARMWQLQRRAEELERKLRNPRAGNKELARERDGQIQQTRSEKEQETRLHKRNQNLERQLQAIHSSRTWRALRMIDRIKARVLDKS